MIWSGVYVYAQTGRTAVVYANPDEDMEDKIAVNEKATARQPITTRYPVDRIKLLEAIQAKRRDQFLSDTLAHALDRMIEEHFPGATEGAA